MKYICLVYHDPKQLHSISSPDLESIVKNVDVWLGELEAGGKHVFSAGLQSPSTATSFRERDGDTLMTDGPFAETKECLGGFTIIEARDLNEALQQGSKLARACGGTVEVRPLMDPNGELTDPFDQKLAAALRSADKQEAHS